MRTPSPTPQTPTNGALNPVSSSLTGEQIVPPTGFEDGRITVSVRIRPLNAQEAAGEDGVCIAPLEAYQTLYIFPTNEPVRQFEMILAQNPKFREVPHHRFTFDHVYSSKTPQKRVYEQIGRPVLHASFDGFNTCILAYGQTGSGKSYSMMGAHGGRDLDDAPGIIPRICQELFAEVERRKVQAVLASEVVDFKVFVSYLEIYRERVRCLLNVSRPKRALVRRERSPPPPFSGSFRRARSSIPPVESVEDSLRVREHPTLGVYVEGLAEVPVTSMEEVLELMVRGNERRVTSSTKMNETSSRSHAIFTMQILQKISRDAVQINHETEEEGMEGKDEIKDAELLRPTALETASADIAAAMASVAKEANTRQLGAKINLVDLAGSERVKSTGAEGATLREGAQINKSLTTLGIVINSLASQTMSSNGRQGGGKGTKHHIPYRDSTLTFLLKESLGGNSKTFMIATVSPSTDNYEETMSTLRYADRAKAIVMRAFVNETAGDKRIRELESEVTRLRERIEALLVAEANRTSAEASPSLQLTPPRRPVVLTDSQSKTPGEGGGGGGRDANSCELSAATDLGSMLGDLRDDDGVSRWNDGRFAWGSSSPSTPEPAYVNTLQSELQRAEEMIKQMSATQAENEAHMVELLRRQEEERTEETAATMRVHRVDPYLLNMDGSGDWIVAHLGPTMTFVGVFGDEGPAGWRAEVPKEEEWEVARRSSESNKNENSASNTLSDTTVSFGGGADTAKVKVADNPSTTPQNDMSSNYLAGVRYVRLPAELSEGVGDPHFILERPAATRADTPSPVVLKGCKDYVTFIIRPICATSLVVHGEGDSLILQTGDVLDIGTEHIQLKYMDPSAPPPQTAARVRAVVVIPPSNASPAASSLAGSPARPNVPSLALHMALGTSNLPAFYASPLQNLLTWGECSETGTTNSISKPEGEPRRVSPVRTSAFQSRIASKRSPSTMTIHLDPMAALTAADLQAVKAAPGSISTAAHPGPAATVTAAGFNTRTGDRLKGPAPTRFVGRHNLVLVGPAGGGKTSLLDNLTKPEAPWGQSAFTMFLKTVRSAAIAASHPTIGIRSRTLAVPGHTPITLKVHELGGTPCFGALLDQLPSHRVTYLLCFPLHSVTSLMTLRGVVEDIICRTDSHTAAIVLIGTHADINERGEEDAGHYARLPASRQLSLQQQLEEVEEQVVSLIQMLQPYPELRPSVVGRMAVDNVYRNIYSIGYRAVEDFPQLLQWLGELARERCKADSEFANGLVPTRCIELGRQLSLLRLRGRWCISLRDLKAIANRVSAEYSSEPAVAGTGSRSFTQLAQGGRDQLQHHVQLLSDWGVLMHRFRSLQLRQHVILDVRWLSKLMTALACAPIVAAAESADARYVTGLSLFDPSGEGEQVIGKESALRMLLTPEAELIVDVVSIAATDTPHLLRYGVVSMPVLIAMLEPHLCHSATSPSRPTRRTAYGKRSPSKAATAASGGDTACGSPSPDIANPTGSAARYAVPLAGVLELLVLLDLIILGRRLLVSPPAPVAKCRSLAATVSDSNASASWQSPEASVHLEAGISAGGAPPEEGEEGSDDDDPPEVKAESFVLYPMSFRAPASAGVTWILPSFLSGPFYSFKLDTVPRNFFAKLLCRLATLSDKVYLGPVREQVWGGSSQRWLAEATQTRSGGGGDGSGGNGGGFGGGVKNRKGGAQGPFDSYLRSHAGQSYILPSFNAFVGATTPEGRQRHRGGFWSNAAWLVYRGDNDVAGVDPAQDDCRVFIRLVHHSVFLSFHCHSVAAVSAQGAYGVAGPTTGLGVQDFYEAVLEAVRSMVEEFPGCRCAESMQCCMDAATLLQSEMQHPAVQSDEEAAELEEYVQFMNVSDNINNLDRVLSWSGAAMRTARTKRRSPGQPGGAGDAEEVIEYAPLLRHFRGFPPLAIADCIRRWRVEQRLHITPEVEEELTTALQGLETCYHSSRAGTGITVMESSCTHLDYFLDVLARIDSI